MNTTPNTKAPKTLVDTAMAFLRGKLLCAAARLGIADVLGHEEKSLDEIATKTNADSDSLYRLMRALASLGVVEEVAPARFALTPYGEPLRKNAPNSVWASVVFWADLIADVWTYLPECVRTGSKSFDAMEQQGVKSRWSMEPNATAIFHAVFAERDAAAMTPFVEAYNFDKCEIVADLGGAGGALLTAILTAHPETRGILVDRQEATEHAAQKLNTAGLSERCRIVAGDLMEDVPNDASTYVLQSVLHGYQDDDARRILQNCHRAMSPSNRLLIIDAVLPTTIRPGDSRVEQILISDLNMLAATGGRERSLNEWQSLLSSTGFQILRVVDIPEQTAGIIEAAHAP